MSQRALCGAQCWQVVIGLCQRFGSTVRRKLAQKHRKDGQQQRRKLRAAERFHIARARAVSARRTRNVQLRAQVWQQKVEWRLQQRRFRREGIQLMQPLGCDGFEQQSLRIQRNGNRRKNGGRCSGSSRSLHLATFVSVCSATIRVRVSEELTEQRVLICRRLHGCTASSGGGGSCN